MIYDAIAALPLAASDAGGPLEILFSQIALVGLVGRVAIGIGLVIFVHELGHFLAAKTFGVKCEKFYVGFDVPIRIGPIKLPRTLGKFQYGETEYGIGILPLGGYVKMLGQDDDPRKAEEEAERIRVEGGDADEPLKLDPRSYPAKPVWQRMIIISAGVVMNIVTGVLFAAIAFGYGVKYNPAIIGGVTPGGPAWQAGILPGGQVESVGDLEDDQMHFREMRLAILTAGLDQPDDPIDISIRYDDSVRDYKLRTAPHPEDEDMRMIGITSPRSITLSDEIGFFTAPGSVAGNVLEDEDAGATVVAFNDREIDTDAIVPGTPLFDFLYSHPSEPVTLRLRRTDGSERDVEVPPQESRSLGMRFKIGPVIALVKDGPAEKAGMEIGDVITAIDKDTSIDAFGFPVQMAGRKTPTKLTVARKKGDSEETLELEITPSDSPQTLSPTSGMSGEIAINSLGIAYRPEHTIAGVDSDNDSLQAGDLLKEVRLAWSDADVPESMQDERFDELLQTLREGWEFTNAQPLTALNETLQLFPAGTQITALATRPPNGRVVEGKLTLAKDGTFQFERGLGFRASESVQTASSFSEAMALGMREGKRRLTDVFRFLGMLGKGKVNRKQVGGPIRIVQLALNEAERGISPQLLFLTMLSMNLAILNFLPIPALDGGHMLFLIAEAIRGRRVDEQIEMRLTLAGVLALLALMAFVFINDIVNS